jgi:hypothetical protein
LPGIKQRLLIPIFIVNANAMIIECLIDAPDVFIKRKNGNSEERA